MEYEDDMHARYGDGEDDDGPDDESTPVTSQALVPMSKKADAASVDGSVSTIHSSYLSHIRSLQRTNGALTKKVDALTSLQSDATRMKLVKKLQRGVREKQTLVDELAELVLSRGVMSPEELTKHMQIVIEAGAIDQVNPAKAKKDIADARKENTRLLAELRETRRMVRNLEAAASAATTNGSGSPSSAHAQPRTSATTARQRDSAAASAARADADRLAQADAVSRELLDLSTAHTALQAAHHSQTLALAEHRRLVEAVTVENRALRGHLAQWEAAEERRVLAEQSAAAANAQRAEWVAEQEALYQEMRAMKSRLRALVDSKAEVRAEAAAQVAESQKSVDAAVDRANHLAQQLALLKTDLRNAHEMVSFHRAQNLLHLTHGEEQEAAERAKRHVAQVADLERQVREWRAKCELAIETARDPDDDDADAEAATYAKTVLRENSRLHAVTAALEAKLGGALAAAEASAQSARAAAEVEKRITSELAVLQLALHQMAKDLQVAQRAASDAERAPAASTSAAQEQAQVKLAKMRAQRQGLAEACQRQNATIRELTREVERLRGSAGASRPSSAKLHRNERAREAQAAAAVESPTTADSNSHSHHQHHQQQQHRTAATPTTSTPSTRPSSAAPASASAQDRAQITGSASSQALLSPSRSASKSALAASPSQSQLAASPSPTADWFDPTGTWSRYPTEDGTAFFYYNHHTNDSVWTDPLAEQPAAAVAATTTHAGATTLSTPAPAPAASSRSLRDSDLDLTPLSTARFDDLPQLSSRGAAAAREATDQILDDFPEEEF